MSAARSLARLHGDGGQVAGIEALPFGVLTFVVGSLLVANAWAVVDAKMAMSSAAAQAARAYVEAPDPFTAQTSAREAARQAVSGHGRDAHRTVVAIDHVGGRSWERCVRVRVTVTHPIHAITVPWIGGYGDGFDVTASHSEIVDPYRAGVPGEARC